MEDSKAEGEGGQPERHTQVFLSGSGASRSGGGGMECVRCSLHLSPWDSREPLPLIKRPSNCGYGESNFFKKIIFIIYLFLAVLGLHCSAGFTLVAVSGGYF